MLSKLELRKAKEKQSRDSLDDSYIIKLLKVGTFLKVSDIKSHPEIIECKRGLIKIDRLLKSQIK
jgi:hypothetical protein